MCLLFRYIVDICRFTEEYLKYFLMFDGFKLKIRDACIRQMNFCVPALEPFCLRVL